MIKMKKIALFAISVLLFFACGSENDVLEPTAPADTKAAPIEKNKEIDFSINPGGGTGSGTITDPAIAQCGDTLRVAITQKSSYTDPDGTVFTCEPQATVTLFTAADTLFVKDMQTLLDVKEISNTQSETVKDNVKTVLRAQKFSVGGKEISFDFTHEIYTYINSENTAIEMPSVKINPADDGTAKVNDGNDTSGITPVVMNARAAPWQTRAGAANDSTTYEVTVSFTLGLESVNTQDSNLQTLSFEVKFFSVVETEDPSEKKLTAINYRKGYQWYEPHDNLPLSYQYIVYRDSVFSDGSVHTMESRSSNTAMEWMLNLAGWTWDIGYNQGKEDVGGTIVYYFKANWYNDAYCNAKITRTIAVPNLSRITYLPNGIVTGDAHQLDSYLRWIDGKPYQFDVNNPEAGWYTRDFFYYDYGHVWNNYMGEGGFLTEFNTESRWYNRLFYTEDDLNGKVLINFLGDENDIDNESYEAQFNVTVDEESFTMPTGEPAKVFSKKLVTTMLGRQFNYEVVDTVYQYDPAHPPF